MKNKSLGTGKIVFLIGALILFFGLRHLFPAFGTFVLVAAGIFATLVVLIVILVIYFTKQDSEEKKDGNVSADANASLAKGRASLMELRRLKTHIKNPQIRSLGEEICQIVDKILRTLKEQPEDISTARQFFNYYLPMLGSILLKYSRLEESSTATAEITQSTISCLEDMKTALEKQYTNLFEDDILDLSVDLEALSLVCKRDGLLDDDFDIMDK